MKTITTNEGRNYKQISRWLQIKNIYVTKRHSLSDYADFSESENEGLLSYFLYKGKKYAVGQFMRLTQPEFFENEDGKTSYLCGYDCTNYYKPFICEIDDSGEAIRLYQEIA